MEEFINLKQGNISVEEYYLKFSMLSSYAPSLVSNAMDEMSHFVMGVSYLVREERRTTMLYDNMIVGRHMVYAQSIEESKLKSMSSNLKRSSSSDQEQSRFKKRAQNQEEPRSAKVKLEKGGGSQNIKPTCVTCGKRHYGECLLCTGSFYGCGKEGHKVRNFPNIASRGKNGKKVAPNVSNEDVPKAKAHFYDLRTRGEKSDGDYYEVKSFLFF